MSLNKIVLLTGDINNAGDFMIARQAKALFHYFLPKCELILINRKYLKETDIDLINSANLAVIVGGPAINNNCLKTLGLVNYIEKIKVPVIMFGVGTANYDLYKNYSLNFSNETKLFFDKLEKFPIKSTVRDLKSLYYLQNAGYKNFEFTGCPVFYNLDTIGNEYEHFKLKKVKTIVFSCGKPSSKDKKAFEQQLILIKNLKKFFGKDRNFIIAFHHSANEDDYIKIYGKENPIYFDFVKRVKNGDYKIIDISNDSQKMFDLYSNCDLHIGYRVHAHVFCTSIRKSSLLINEDFRGCSIGEIIQSTNFNAYNYEYKYKLFSKNKFTRLKVYNKQLYNEIISTLKFADKNNLILNWLPEIYFSYMENWFKNLYNYLYISD